MKTRLGIFIPRKMIYISIFLIILLSVLVAINLTFWKIGSYSKLRLSCITLGFSYKANLPQVEYPVIHRQQADYSYQQIA